ncbi:MAG: (d)CMP kinase [Proteobacteria bacterium]|nr:(d)CMP kinase [Pseudomonadota bacterium]
MSGFPADKTRNPLAGVALTVDGVYASGKGTLAMALARRYRLKFLDTGALYRALAWWVLEQGVDVRDREQVVRLARALEFDFHHKGNNVFGVWVHGREVTDEIRTPLISQNAPLVATQPEVRQALLDFQVNYGKAWKPLVGVIFDGRDTGARIAPDAEVKIFLTANPLVRARRRWLEYTARGKEISLPEVEEEMRVRDARDVDNTIQCPDAVVIDASELDVPGVLKAAIAATEGKLGPVPPAPAGE